MTEMEKVVTAALVEEDNMTDDEFVQIIMDNSETVSDCREAIDYLLFENKRRIAHKIDRVLNIKIAEMPMSYIR